MSEAFEQSKKLIILTILYNLVEGIFALYFGLESNSTSLLSFGLDSFIEITASGIALWGVTSKNETSHNQAEKLIAYSFLLLIVFILIKSSFDLININKDNIFKLDKNKLSNRINENNLVSTFLAKKDYPNKVNIQISKAKYFGKIYRNGQLYIIGSNGKLINYDADSMKDLPYFYGTFKREEFLKFSNVSSVTLIILLN